MRPHSPRTHAQCEQIGKRGISEILALIGHLLIVELDDQDVRARPCSVRFGMYFGKQRKHRASAGSVWLPFLA